MRIKRQKWIVAAILTGVLALGFLAGISASRPLKEVCLLYTSPSPRD